MSGWISAWAETGRNIPDAPNRISPANPDAVAAGRINELVTDLSVTAYCACEFGENVAFSVNGEVWLSAGRLGLHPRDRLDVTNLRTPHFTCTKGDDPYVVCYRRGEALFSRWLGAMLSSGLELKDFVSLLQKEEAIIRSTSPGPAHFWDKIIPRKHLSLGSRLTGYRMPNGQPEEIRPPKLRKTLDDIEV